MRIGSDLVVVRHRGPLAAIVPNLWLALAIIIFGAGFWAGVAITLARLS